tara:strand:+ start:16173 stop:17072 length:900 start_codon:yes stop_codon:yes gene_type:complete
MSTTSQLLSEYIKKTSGQVSSSLNESEQQRYDAIKNIVKDEKARRNEIAEIKPSEILKEFKARDTLEQYAEAESQMKKFGITDKSVQQFVKEEEERRTSSLKGLEERFKKEREAEEEKTKKLLTSEEEKQTITNAENSVIDGSSPTYNYAINAKSRRTSVVYNSEDINYIRANQKEPDFSQGESFFTEADIYSMIENKTFENAGITLDEIKKFLNMPNTKEEQENYQIPVKGSQDLIYKYLSSPESSALRTSYNIEIRDESQKDNQKLAELLIGKAFGLQSTEAESTLVQSSLSPRSKF